MTEERLPEDEELYRQGLAAWKERRLPDARIAFTELIDAVPDDAFAWIALGRVTSEMGDVGAAQTAIAMACRLAPDNAEILTVLAEDHLRAGRLLDALVAACQSLAIITSDGETLALGGKIISRLAASTPDAHDLSPLSEVDQAVLAKTIPLIADMLATECQWNAAAFGYSVAVKITPDSATYLNDLGTALLMAAQLGDDLSCIGRLGEALEYFLKGIALAPDNSRLYSNLGMLCLFIAERKAPKAAEAAAHCLTQAFKLAPEDMATRQSLADLFYSRRDLDTAAEILAGGFPSGLDTLSSQKALQAFIDSFSVTTHEISGSMEAAANGDPAALDRLGTGLVSLNFISLAASFFNTALRKTPDNEDLRDKLGVTLINGRLLHETVALFSKDDTLHPPPLVRSFR
jgi:tetratricopeptide (TPR) repeat protein